MYISGTRAHEPAKAWQRLMNDTMVSRVAAISDRKAWDAGAVQVILFRQGYGRKSLVKVRSARMGAAAL